MMTSQQADPCVLAIPPRQQPRNRHASMITSKSWWPKATSSPTMTTQHTDPCVLTIPHRQQPCNRDASVSTHKSWWPKAARSPMVTTQHTGPCVLEVLARQLAAPAFHAASYRHNRGSSSLHVCCRASYYRQGPSRSHVTLLSSHALCEKSTQPTDNGNV